MFAGKALRCECGYEVRASDEDDFVEEIRRHASETHGITFSAELARKLARGATETPSDVSPGGEAHEEVRSSDPQSAPSTGGGEMHKSLVMRGLALVTVVAAAAVAALATVPQSAASAAAEACPGGGPMLVNSYATYRNSADFGADGHVWALDAARESIQIWRIGTNTYCFKRQDIGTFTTFAGVSPEGTGTVSGGVTGPWYGELVIAIHGTFAPTVPTSGFVGDFNLQCQQDGTCLGPVFNARNYFSSFDSLQFLTRSATFAGGTCGVWRQSIAGDTGDILC